LATFPIASQGVDALLRLLSVVTQGVLLSFSGMLRVLHSRGQRHGSGIPKEPKKIFCIIGVESGTRQATTSADPDSQKPQRILSEARSLQLSRSTKQGSPRKHHESNFSNSWPKPLRLDSPWWIFAAMMGGYLVIHEHALNTIRSAHSLHMLLKLLFRYRA
jgi:hypothetical protein